MFSVMKTELKVFPLCTKNVCPTKSGVTIERRDQILIGFFALELFILSIFSRRYDSTKGPFFNDLPIIVKFGGRRLCDAGLALPLSFLLRPSPFQNEPVARFVLGPGLES